MKSDTGRSLIPPRGSIWETRIRVLGESAIGGSWTGVMICEILTGPDAGEKIALDARLFDSKTSGKLGERRGIFDEAKLAPARRRPSEATG